MKDLIIGAITKYTYDKIEPWVNSIEKSGFDGHKALIVYDLDVATANKLVAKGFRLFGFERDDVGNFSYPKGENFSIMVERFAHAWYFISQIEDPIRNVIWTDVKDVVFQRNPSDWFDENLEFGSRRHVLVASENFKYKDEPWNKNNMELSFGPVVYDSMKNKPVYCAGVIAGTKEYVTDLFKEIFLICRGSPSEIPGGGGPDQAALNVLLSQRIYHNVTEFTSTDDDWAAHLGTSMPAILSGSGGIGEAYMRDPSTLNTYKQTMLDNDPVMIDDVVRNHLGKPYVVVHQYDRVKDWYPILDKKYRA
jgi:hypothetical protein